MGLQLLYGKRESRRAGRAGRALAAGARDARAPQARGTSCARDAGVRPRPCAHEPQASALAHHTHPHRVLDRPPLWIRHP